VGLVGSAQLKEFTFVGRSVNLAARVQNLTRTLPANVIVTQALADTLDPRFRLRPLPDTRVKGIESPVAIYAVDGFEEDARPG
jgi:class 3 adenylate cyclase